MNPDIAAAAEKEAVLVLGGGMAGLGTGYHQGIGGLGLMNQPKVLKSPRLVLTPALKGADASGE